MGNLAEVKIREIDISLVNNPTTGNAIALFVGSAERGPAGEMTLITDSLSLQKKFGNSTGYDTFEANLYIGYANSPIFFIRSVSPILLKDIPNKFVSSNASGYDDTDNNLDASIDWVSFKDISNGYYFTNIHQKFVTFLFLDPDDTNTTLDSSSITGQLIIFDKDLYPSLYNSISSIQKALLDKTSAQNISYLKIIKNTLNSYKGNTGFWIIDATIDQSDITDATTGDVTGTATTYSFNVPTDYSYFVFNDKTFSTTDDATTKLQRTTTTLELKLPNLIDQLFKYGHLIKEDGTINSNATDIDDTTNILTDSITWSSYLTNGGTTTSYMPITTDISNNIPNITKEDYVIDFILTPSVYIDNDTLEIFAPISMAITNKPTMTYLFGINADTTEDVTSIVAKVQSIPGFPADDMASYYATIYPNIYYGGTKINAATALAIMYAKKGAEDFYQPAANTRWGSIVFATGIERHLFRNEADILYSEANVNPIISKSGNPAVIWGNRTLYLANTGTSSARSMLSFRLVLNRYKTELQNLLSQYLFTVGDFNEIYNTIAINLNAINERYVGKAFRSVVTSNLTTADEETNHILHIQVEITPNYSVEKIYVDVVITNAGITMQENG